MLGDKLRFRFAKTGTLRLLSHHDMMRCLERMLRRAAVPFKSTLGFHPGPRVVFAQSLPLGVVGRNEVVEIELLQACEADDILAKLNEEAPIGLSFASVRVVPMKATAMPRRIVYELTLPEERVEAARSAAIALYTQEAVWVERLKPNPKRLNIRPYLRNLFVLNSELQTPNPRLVMDLWVTGTGTARADELLRLLGLYDVFDAGAALERTTVELRDEVIDAIDHPPDGPADTRPLEQEAIEALRQRDVDSNQTATAHWGLSPSGPVVE